MKLLFFTDLHWRGDSPRARKDKYPETAAFKLAEVAELAKAHAVKAILFGGDLTDQPTLDNGPMGDLAKALKRLEVPVYGVAGNTHDLPGDNWSALRRTPLGIMEKAGLIHLLQPGAPVLLEEEGITVQVSGQGYHPDMDRRPYQLDYAVLPDGATFALEGHAHFRAPEVQYAVHIIHGMLRTEPLMAGIPVTIVGDVLNSTTADITLSGHDHLGYGVIREHGRFACNPGALMRVTAAREEMERPVQVALITVDAAGCTVELIPLRTALPGPEVLDRTKLEQAKANETAREDFMALVKTGGDFQALDPATLVARMAEAKTIPEHVRVKAMEYVQVAAEAVARKTALEEAV